VALSQGGKVIAGVSAVVVAAGAAVGVLALTGNDVVSGILNKPQKCPLTGAEPNSGKVPDRPALAI
jgi:hypothetical protein